MSVGGATVDKGHREDRQAENENEQDTDKDKDKDTVSNLFIKSCIHISHRAECLPLSSWMRLTNE
jgi:hypothetical protein